MLSLKTEMEYESPVPSPVREPSPEREPSPAPESPIPQEIKEDPVKEEKSSHNGEKHRKRRRKLVPKTFMDDDGYMGMDVVLM